MKKEGSQIPLSYNNDRDVKRIVIKDHLCGVAIAYQPHTHKINEVNERPGRPQGSLYSQQKRKIADACEWLRVNSTYKPLIFVATSPGFTNHASESGIIKTFTHNLRNGYDCKNYVWVREFTQAGFPHFHFVADMPDINPVDLSLYWSGLFGADAKNSIRLGTAPNAQGKRQFYLKGKRMSWYMTKYLGKSIGHEEEGAIDRRRFRSFAISQALGKASAPLLFGEEIIRSEWGGLHQRQFTLNNEQAEAYWEKEIPAPTFDTKSKRWSWTGHGNTFIGRPKQWKVS